MCQSTTMSTHRGSIANSLNGELLSPMGSNGHHNTKLLHNQGPTTQYHLSQENYSATTSPSSSSSTNGGNVSNPSAAHFTGPPPLPLFYLPYPSPPLSPPNNYYTTLQNGPNPLISPLIGPVQNGFQIARPSGPLSICSIGGGNATHSSSIATHGSTASQQPSINNFINVPPLASPEIGKAVWYIFNITKKSLIFLQKTVSYAIATYFAKCDIKWLLKRGKGKLPLFLFTKSFIFRVVIFSQHYWK